MRKSIRRLIAAIKFLSFPWLAGCVVVAVMHWDLANEPLRLAGNTALAMLPGFGGLALAWILEGGFAKTNRNG
jgi:hypothetical protein